MSPVRKINSDRKPSRRRTSACFAETEALGRQGGPFGAETRRVGGRTHLLHKFGGIGDDLESRVLTDEVTEQYSSYFRARPVPAREYSPPADINSEHFCHPLILSAPVTDLKRQTRFPVNEDSLTQTQTEAENADTMERRIGRLEIPPARPGATFHAGYRLTFNTTVIQRAPLSYLSAASPRRPCGRGDAPHLLPGD